MSHYYHRANIYQSNTFATAAYAQIADNFDLSNFYIYSYIIKN